MVKDMHKIHLHLLFIFLLSSGTVFAQWKPGIQSYEGILKQDLYVTYLEATSAEPILIMASENQIKLWNEKEHSLKDGLCVKPGAGVIACTVNPYDIGIYKDKLILLSPQQIHFSSNKGSLWEESGLNKSITEWKKNNFRKPAERSNEIYFTEFAATSEYIYLIGMKFSGVTGKPYESVIFRSDDEKLQDWKNVSPVFPSKPATLLTSIYIKDDKNFWAVGKNGAIMYSDNAGKTWSPQSSGIPSTVKNQIDLRDVYFIDSNTGWAVGDAGHIVATKNGGATWNRQASPSSESLRKVKFITATTGWAIGLKGTILFTRDGGEKWESQNNGFNDFYNITAVEFRPDRPEVEDYHNTTEWIAYVVGGGGKVLTNCSAFVCAEKDLSKIEKKLSARAAKLKDNAEDDRLKQQNDNLEKQNAVYKERVKQLNLSLEGHPDYKGVNAELVKNTNVVKLNGNVRTDKIKDELRNFARKFTQLEIDDYEVRPPKESVSNPIVIISDEGNYDYEELRERSSELNCSDSTKLRYTATAIGIQKPRQDNFQNVSFTSEAAQLPKTQALGCVTAPESQYFLITQNGIYISKKDRFLKPLKWDLMAPLSNHLYPTLFRKESVQVTDSHIFILGSVYTKNKKFEYNVVYIFNKLKQDEPEIKEIESDSEFVKIFYNAARRQLEIWDRSGKKKISRDEGNNWRSER